MYMYTSYFTHLHVICIWYINLLALYHECLLLAILFTIYSIVDSVQSST